MTNEEMLSVAEIVERLVARFHKQADDHEAKMVEHRAAFGVRTEADAKIIAGLREERDRWKSACSDQSALLGVINAALGISAGDNVCGEIDRLQKECDALRAEVAALQERLRASIARGDFAQMEVAALKSQTPKQSHPVAVGGYLRRLTGFNTTPAGEVARVTLVDDDDPNWPEYEVVRSNGQKGRWSAKGCEPCDPPEATHAEPDLTQFHAKGKEAWSDVPNATQWVEEMRGNTEATHDTPEGKDLAESVIRDSRSRDINDGDLVEVVSNTGRNTWLADVGSVGTVTSIETINDSISVRLDDVPGKKNVLAGYVSLCDVRKMTA